jgi:hypothetical protein
MTNGKHLAKTLTTAFRECHLIVTFHWNDVYKMLEISGPNALEAKMIMNRVDLGITGDEETT